jgi:hypothetical protein
VRFTVDSSQDNFIGFSIEWSYEPADFLERPLAVSCDGCTLEATAGRTVAKVSGNLTQERCDLWEGRLENEVRQRFTASQLVRPRPFTMQLKGSQQFRKDGTSTVMAALHGSYLIVQGNAPDVLIRAPDGTVIVDQQAARRKREERLAEALICHSDDPLLVSMVASFRASISDPTDSFVHLYEIKEQLLSRFGKSFTHTLGVDDDDVRKYIHELSNAAIRQGRHRGKHAGKLRDATPEELRAAQDTALRLIEGYLQHVGT